MNQIDERFSRLLGSCGTSLNEHDLVIRNAENFPIRFSCDLVKSQQIIKAAQFFAEKFYTEMKLSILYLFSLRLKIVKWEISRDHLNKNVFSAQPFSSSSLAHSTCSRFSSCCQTSSSQHSKILAWILTSTMQNALRMRRL